MKHLRWTKVAFDPFFSYAFKHMASDKNRTYHNIDHVTSMYEYLYKTKEPYDFGLDVAVLFHDFIYDEGPHKEYRSAMAMNDYFSEMKEVYADLYGPIYHEKLLQSKAFQMIKATETHLVSEPYYSAIVRADLHGLSNRVSAFRNYCLVLEESQNIYGVTTEQFAAANIHFMEGLRDRVRQNIRLDPEWRSFYTSVIDGIDATCSISDVILGRNVPRQVE